MCGKKCTPQHVVMAECTACEGSKAEYLRKLENALEAVAKTVPKVTMDRSTPMARWCDSADSPEGSGGGTAAGAG